MSHVVYVVPHKWTESEQGSTNHLVMLQWIDIFMQNPCMLHQHFIKCIINTYCIMLSYQLIIYYNAGSVGALSLLYS